MDTDLIKWTTFLNDLESNKVSLTEIISFLSKNIKHACYGCYFCSQSAEELSHLYPIEEKLIKTIVEDCNPENRNIYEEVIYLPIQDIYLKRVGSYEYDEQIQICSPFFKVNKYTKTIEYYE